MDRFLGSVFIGGDFRLRSRPALGGPVITAVRGEWGFRDGSLADRIQTVVNGERTFWNDRTQSYFLVVLTPLKTKPGWRSSNGTGLSESFVAFVSDGTPLEALDFLWAHEYFHNWNNAALGRFEEPEADLYWFSEGFTDYYADLLRVRWGMGSLDQYAETLDEKIEALAESPVRRLPNKDIAPRFFTDRAIGRLPYLRGQLLAAQWDSQIRAASHGHRSLDDLMRSLREENLRGARVLDVPRIIERATAEGVVDAKGDIERQIDRGGPAHLSTGVFAECIMVGEKTKPGILHHLPDGAPVTRQTATLRPALTEAERTSCLQSLRGTPPTQVTSDLLPTSSP